MISHIERPILDRQDWSAIDDRGETELITVRDELGYTWELFRLTDNVILFRVWCPS